MMNLLVYKYVCETLLIVSGGVVELNPGPSKTCPKYETYLPNRTIVCSFRYTLRNSASRSNSLRGPKKFPRNP